MYMSSHVGELYSMYQQQTHLWSNEAISSHPESIGCKRTVSVLTVSR